MLNYESLGFSSDTYEGRLRLADMLRNGDIDRTTRMLAARTLELDAYAIHEMKLKLMGMRVNMDEMKKKLALFEHDDKEAENV